MKKTLVALTMAMALTATPVQAQETTPIGGSGSSSMEDVKIGFSTVLGLVSLGGFIAILVKLVLDNVPKP